MSTTRTLTSIDFAHINFIVVEIWNVALGVQLNAAGTVLARYFYVGFRRIRWSDKRIPKLLASTSYK